MTKIANDGLQSATTGMGMIGQDKAASCTYTDRLFQDVDYENMYSTSWIAKKIIDIPADDAVCKWRSWQADQNQITLLEKEENRLGLVGKVRQCLTLSRLYGGAAIYIGTADQDLEEPLNVERMGKGGVKYLTVISRKEMSVGEIDRDPASEYYGKPKYYEIHGETQTVRIHPSRIVRMIGEEHPDPFRAVGHSQGWGRSVLDAIYQAMQNAESTANNVSSMVFEANVDVFGIPDLMAQVSDCDYSKKILERFRLAAMGKSVNKTLIHDSDESYQRKQLTFATLPELMQEFFLEVSGAADIPMVRFLGQSPKGLSSTGEGDLNNYYDHIKSIQTLDIEPTMALLDECIIRSAIGSRPENIWYKWTPLKQMSEKETAEIGEKTSKTIQTLMMSGLFTAEEMRKVAINQFSEQGIFPGIDKISEESGDDIDFDLGSDGGDDDGES